MLRRVIPATAVSALLIAGITGCSAQQTADACTPLMQSGALSDNVIVDGEFHAAPALSAPSDIVVDTSQRTVVSEAEDRSVVAGENSLVGVNMAFFDSASGEQVYESPAFGSAASPEFLLIDETQPNPLSESVRCLATGDRAVLALGVAESQQLAMNLQIPVQGNLVGIVDVETVSGLAVSGKAQGLPNGFPAVVTNDDGRPGVVLPPRNAPEGTTVAVRIQGDGAEITDENNVIAQVLQVGWDGSELLNTWDTGITGLGNVAQIEMSGNTFRAALTGQQAGSQVVVVENLEDGTPSVLVIDILGVS